MFFYKCQWYDYDQHKEHTETGLVATKTYHEAVKKLTEYYGSNAVLSLYVEEWDDILTEDEILEGFEEKD